MEQDFTTFYMDFTIADHFGIEAIKDTFNRAFEEWKTDYKYLTFLVLNLNHKIWEHYENRNEEYARLYDRLWRQADEYATEYLKGEELNYYLRVLD